MGVGAVAVEVEGPYEIHDFTVANANAIAKGTYLKYADPRTASASTGSADNFAGFAASEKEASDGVVNMGVYQKGIFLVTACGSITAGAKVVTAAPGNYVRQHISGVGAPGAHDNTSHDNVVGTALETMTDNTTGEVDIGRR